MLTALYHPQCSRRPSRFIDPVSIGLNSGFETRVFPIDKAAMVGHAAGLALAAAVLMSS